MNELFQSIAYTRFNISKKGILWAVMDEELTPSAIHFFANRFPLFLIMIEKDGITYVKKSEGRTMIYDERIQNVLKRYESRMKDNPLLKDLLENTESLWEDFYDSQYIKERKNHKLFHHFIPKYLKNIKALKKEFESLNPSKKITDYY